MNYDFVVQGAGLVGSMFVSLLSKNFPNKKILLLDLNPLIDSDSTLKADDPIDLRVSAINQATQSIFKSLNLWEQLLKCRHGVFEKIQVTTDFGDVEFSRKDLNINSLAYTFENSSMLNVLHKHITYCPNVDYKKAFIESFVDNYEYIDITLSSNEKISTKLLIAADGGKSSIRRLLNMPMLFKDYNQNAIVANIKAHGLSKNTAFQTFYNGGIIAWLPLHEKNVYSIVWSQEFMSGEDLQKLSDTKFVSLLKKHDESGLHSLELLGKIASFPLVMSHSLRYTKGNAVLIGDSAHVVHPLAGQGVNLGFADANELVDSLLENADFKEIRYRRALKAYSANRTLPNHLTQMAMSSMKYIFSDGIGKYIPGIENVFKFTNNSTYIKKNLVEAAKGL